MYPDTLLVACLPIGAAANSAEWLTNDASAIYRALDPVDFPADLLSRVYKIYRDTYEAYGPPLIEDEDELLEYDRFVLFFEEGTKVSVTTVHASKLIAVAVFRVKEVGLKGGMRASDGSKAGRTSVKRFAVSSYCAQRVFGEISGRLEKAILHEVPTIPVRCALLVLAALGKVGTPTKNDHYTRLIEPIGVQEKVMVGDPLVPPGPGNSGSELEHKSEAPATEPEDQ